MTNDSIAVASTWREYTTADYGTHVDLTRGGYAPRKIVMKEAGDLRCEDAYGNVASLTGLPQWYVHTGCVSALLPGQRAALIVYW
jgi:hypothetical protein